MEVNNTNRNSQILVGDSTRELQNAVNRSGNEKVEEKAGFQDAAIIDLTDPNAKRSETRELSKETQQFLENKGVDIAKESANFDKQSVLAVAGSMVASQGDASTVNARALLS